MIFVRMAPLKPIRDPTILSSQRAKEGSWDLPAILLRNY